MVASGGLSTAVKADSSVDSRVGSVLSTAVQVAKKNYGQAYDVILERMRSFVYK